uniref:Uncharacterized protein n=1 Tax=Ascaris lumbricoides TaxID=6252 RepID=A0A0M3I165_ASCLU
MEHVLMFVLNKRQYFASLPFCLYIHVLPISIRRQFVCSYLRALSTTWRKLNKRR